MEPSLQAYTTQNTGSRFQFSRKHLRIFAIVATFLIAAGAIWFYVNQYLYKSKAGTEDVTVQFTPAKDRVEPGEEFTMPVRLTADATKEISGAQLFITWDEGQDKVEYIPQQLPGLSADFSDLVIQETATVGTSKQLKLTVTATTSAQLKNISLINLKFKAKTQTGTATFKVDPTTSQVSGTAANYIFNIIAEDKTIGIGQDPVVPSPTVSGSPTGVTGTQPTGTQPTGVPPAQGAYYYPLYLRNWPFADGKKQWTYPVITNPNNESIDVTINIYGVASDNTSPIKTIKRTIAPSGTWNAIYEPQEWFNAPLTQIDGVTDGTRGFIEVIPSKQLPLNAVTREIVGTNATIGTGSEHFEDEPFTNILSDSLIMTVYTKNLDTGDDRYKQYSDITVANPNNNEVTATMNFYDGSGATKNTITFKVPAKGVYSSFNKPEWNNLPEGIAWAKINTQNGKVLGIRRTKIHQTSSPTSKVMMYDTELLTPEAETSNKLYYPLYTKRWPSGNQNLVQWAHPVLVNPQAAGATATITVRKMDGGVIGSPLQVQVPANGIWNSYGNPQWYSIPEINQSNNGSVGWIEIQSTQPLTGMMRATLRKLNNNTNPANNGSYKADIEFLTDDVLVTEGKLMSNAAAPFYLQHWPAFEVTEKQWNNVILLNPHNEPVSFAIKIRSAKNAQLINTVGGIIPPKGVWNSYARPGWYGAPFSTTYGNADANYGWMEVQSTKKIAMLNRITMRQEQGAQVFNSPITQLGDDTDTFTTSNPVPMTCDGASCPPGYTCKDGYCFPPRCENSSQCPPGYVCNGGKCFPPTCTIGMTCPPGYSCNNGICTPPQCNADNPCPPGFICDGGACRTADMSISMKLRFQGVLNPPIAPYNKMRVKVAVGGGGLPQPVETTAEFTATEGYTWEGTAFFNGIPAGDNYYFLIKGPKHLQRKVCEIDPTKLADTENGFYTCTDYVESFVPLKKGEQSFDFTNIYQPAGDLPMGGRQDGVIDSIDLVYLRSKLGSKNASDFATGDLNLDQIIDSQDHSLPVKVLDLNMNTDDE